MQPLLTSKPFNSSDEEDREAVSLMGTGVEPIASDAWISLLMLAFCKSIIHSLFGCP